MVFFSCNACNESLKKNQVEKHYTTKCRRCEFLSCIDCGKEFWGDSYQTHTKCVSEEEKYSGKNYVAKPNKGEVKQEQWIQKVQSAIQKAQSNPQLKNLLQRLEEFPNVPRKKAKFENFLKCSLRVMNKGLMNQVWDLLMAETQQQNGSNTTSTASEGESKPQPSTSSVETAKGSSTAETADPDNNETERKLSKRERKENRKKKMHKAEKKDKEAADTAAAEEDSGRKKKGKRRKREEEEEEEEENESCEAASQPKKKKRKGENGIAMETEEAEKNGDDDDSQGNTLALEKKGKFNWGLTITAVLEAKGEISVKRLQKKVLAEYASYGGGKPEEKVVSKFNKKLSKLPHVKVLKDKAKLIQS